MRKDRGHTTIQAIIIFSIIALLIPIIFQTIQFLRVRTVVQQAAEEAARVYASNYEHPNRELVAKEAAMKLIASNLPVGTVSGTYTSNDAPPGWIRGVLGKAGDKFSILGMILEPATEEIRGKLEGLVGKEVAAKVESISDDSGKYGIVYAAQEDVQTNFETGKNVIPGQLEFAWYKLSLLFPGPLTGRLVPVAQNTSEMDQVFAQKDNIRGKGVWARAVDIDSGASPGNSATLNDMRSVSGMENLPATQFALEFFGFLYVPESGEYSFALDSDDAADILVDGQVVASWYGPHPKNGKPVPGKTVYLERGLHEFRARLNQGPGVFVLKAYWKKPGDAEYSLIDPKYFASAVPDSKVKTITLDDSHEPLLISGSDYATFVVDVNKRLWAVGWNDGRDGMGIQKPFALFLDPVFVRNDVVQVNSKADQLLTTVLTSDGKVLAWGDAVTGGGVTAPVGTIKTLATPTVPRKLVSGVFHVAYMDAEGKVYGTNIFNWYAAGGRRVDGKFVDITGLIPLPEKAIDVSAARNNTYILVQSGTVYSLGDPRGGRLGTGNMDDPNLWTSGYAYAVADPQRIRFGYSERGMVSLEGQIQQVSAFDRGGAALLTKSGEVYVFGPYNGSGKIIYYPTKVSGLSNVVEISAGGDYLLALDRDGKVFVYREGKVQQLAVSVKATKIFASSFTGFIIGADRNTYSVGLNSQGQRGVGSTKSFAWTEVTRSYYFSPPGTYSFVVPLPRPDVVLDETKSTIRNPITEGILEGTFKLEQNKYLYDKVLVDIFSNSPNQAVASYVQRFSPARDWERFELPRYSLVPNPPTVPQDTVYVLNQQGLIKGNGGIRFSFRLESIDAYSFGFSISDSDYFTSTNTTGRYGYVTFFPKNKTVIVHRPLFEKREFKLPDNINFTENVNVEFKWKLVSNNGEAEYTLNVNGNEYKFNGGFLDRVTLVTFTSETVKGWISNVYKLSEEDPNINKISFDVSKIPNGEYVMTYTLMKDDLETPHKLAFLIGRPVKKAEVIKFSVDNPSLSGSYVDPGGTLKATVKIRNLSLRTIEPGQLVVEWRKMGTVVQKYPLSMSKSLAYGEELFASYDLRAPEEKGVYDVVVRFDDGHKNTISTELVFQGVSVGVTPTKSIITAVQEVNTYTQYISTPLVEIYLDEQENFVESKVIYHQPLLWDFGRFFNMGGSGPIWDVVGRSVMRIEKPLFSK